LLGAIIHSQVLYVGYPSGRYVSDWPTKINGKQVSAPEMAAYAQTYDQFISANADRPSMIYVGANDGMLHAIEAPVPTCQMADSDVRCTTVSYAGKEAWAYVPRAVYGNLGRLTSTDDFPFAPTVDATPIMRDVFFGENGDHTWHSLLVGGVRLGGRGLYALDITDPAKVRRAFPQRTVLWEFDADMPPGLSAAGDEYNPADLGYTYGQPAVARLTYGRWAVLAAGGYFPDCSKPDRPAHCEEMGGTPPNGYSALFVIDAQTGTVIRELKTPTDIDGVTSYGLSTPVLGDYNNDHVDDVAFAGDLAGNLWRFDLASPNPVNWKVELAYRPAVVGAQPITVMPRLFPDPATNRFIVVFGTGKYLGEGDVTNDDVPVQSVMGVRDRLDRRGSPITAMRSDLQVQTLSQTTVDDPDDPYDGAVLRTLSSNPIPSGAGGWYIDLNADAGERVVVTPSALFGTNTVLVSTLVPKGFNSPPEGALMAIDAATGGPGAELASVGGVSYAGAALSQSISTGTLTTITPVGGGKLLFPGLKLKGKKTAPDVPLSLKSPLWRRRSWTVLSTTQ
jgi:type IV pilus assembly protein PilY1